MFKQALITGSPNSPNKVLQGEQVGLFVRSTFPKATIRQAPEPSRLVNVSPWAPTVCAPRGCLLGFSPAVRKSGLSHYTPLILVLES